MTEVRRGAARLQVGYRPAGFAGDRTIPQLNFSGRWLEEAGFAVGTSVTLTVQDGRLVLTPEGEEVKQQRAQAQQLKRLDRQQAALRRAKKRVNEALR